MIRFVVVFLRESISNPNPEYAGSSFPGSYKRESSLTSTFFLDFLYTRKLYLTHTTTSISFCCPRVCFIFTCFLRYRTARGRVPCLVEWRRRNLTALSHSSTPQSSTPIALTDSCSIIAVNDTTRNKSFNLGKPL